jgi:hypothetical protein
MNVLNEIETTLILKSPYHFHNLQHKPKKLSWLPSILYNEKSCISLFLESTQETRTETNEDRRMDVHSQLLDFSVTSNLRLLVAETSSRIIYR